MDRYTLSGFTDKKHSLTDISLKLTDKIQNLTDKWSNLTDKKRKSVKKEPPRRMGAPSYLIHNG